MRSRESGFSLVELLVVIAILSIISALVLVAVDPATRLAQARDAQRKSDINQIANALVSYEALRERFPVESLCDSSVGESSISCPPSPLASDWGTTVGRIRDRLVTTENLLKTLPKDPINNITYFYRYEPQFPGQTPCCGYWIGARLEKPEDPTKPIFRCSDIPTAAGPGCKMVVTGFTP